MRDDQLDMSGGLDMTRGSRYVMGKAQEYGRSTKVFVRIRTPHAAHMPR